MTTNLFHDNQWVRMKINFEVLIILKKTSGTFIISLSFMN